VPVVVAEPEPEAPSLPATTANGTAGLPASVNAFTATPEIGVPLPRPRPPGN
jgi:penicillin-insensitive murein DD-endopeptidase